MIQRRWIPGVCVVLLVTVGLVPAPVAGAGSAAEELTKRLPDDVACFVATSGGDVLKGDFEKTALGRIWNDQSVQSFCRSIGAELAAKARQRAEDPNLPRKVDTVLNYARLVLSRPVVLGVAQVEPQEGLPPVCVFAILDAGGRKPELTDAVGRLEAMVEAGAIVDAEVGSRKMHGLKDELQMYWGWVDEYLVLAVNDARGAVAKYVDHPRSAVPAYLSRVPAHGDALVAHYDYQRLLSFLGTLIRQEAGETEANLFTAGVKESGFNQLKTLTARIGFAGPDIVSDLFIGMPIPATGLFAAYGTVDPAWFGAVDARAVTAGAVNIRIAGLYDAFMNIMKAVSPDEGFPEIQQAIAGFEARAGLSIRNGLLASLAGPAVFYSLPAGTMLEAPRGGFVAVVKLKDAALFEKTMTALGEFAGEKAEGVLQIGSLTRDDGRVVHVWAVAPLAMLSIMPSWSVANDHVVVASNAELCDLGVKQLVSRGAGAKSLLDAEGYRKVAAQLPGNLTRLAYTDSRVLLTQTMMQIQQVWPMLTMAAMQAGVKLPVMLPSLTEIARDLGPSCRYNYLGADGLYSHYRGPGIETGQMTVAGTALGLGIMMPALSRVRQLASRMTSATNLSGIGQACLAYADDHDGRLPPDLQTLVREVELSPKSLESKRKPPGFDGPSYIYIPGQVASMHPRNVVAYENPAFCADGINVLFLDRQVEFMQPEAFRRELEATCRRLGIKMPAIRFEGETEASPPAPKATGPSKA